LHFLPFVEQFAHAAPLAPQTASVVPPWHTPFASQQPPQVDAPQVGAVPAQTPSSQSSFFAEQLEHDAPFTPQASTSVPRRQRPSVSQQPAQFDGPHVGAVP
jgi:hypothetical protein